ncbi:MAG TPA: C25 family cysteine peptidase [Candidatus Krumholzibacteria bacterium]|nr:C25 family cysteine peptidase [Candidatus Krumholzibacteria bacterium]
MRSIRITIALIIAVAGPLVLLDGRAGPPSLHFTITTPASGISVETTVQGAVVSAHTDDGQALQLLNDAGLPALPMRVVNVLVPAGSEVAAVHANARHEGTVARDITPVLASAPAPDPDAPRPVVLPSPAAPLAPTAGGESYPSQLVRYGGSGTWHGYTIASIAVFPLRMEGGSLVAATDIDLTVELRAAESSSQGARARRLSAAAASHIDAALRGVVLNPDAAGTYPPIAVKPVTGPFSPSAVPSLEGSPVEYLIITTEAMKPAFDSLATWKTAKGVPTVTRTVEWIEANYRRGTDTAETIRFFLKDAYTNWGTRYVLLAGDTPQIPPRYLYSVYYYGGTYIPADIYFAGLDGSFNALGDARFGEQAVDATDLWVELHVARLPVSTLAAANIVVNKIERYETPADPEYADKVLFLSEVLFPSPWSPGQTIVNNGAAISENVYNSEVNSPSRRTTRMYETEDLFPGSVHESRATAIDSLNAGFNMVFHVGHGYRFNMHCGDDNVAIPDADNLYHPDREFNLFMLNCTAAAFDYDCLGEHMLRNPNGGAVSIIGATNSAFADPSSYYMTAFAHAVFQTGNVNIGEAFTLSRVGRTPLAVFGDGADLWTHYIYTILADPEMPLWTGPVRTATVSAPASVPAGTNQISVQVDVSGMPEPGATVCLWKGTEDYAVGITDGSGSVTLPFTTTQAGSIRAVVTGRNLARHERWISVLPPAGAMLAIDAVLADDDNTGASSGNGDGIIDAGEIIELRPLFHNVGGVASVSASAALACTSSTVTLSNTALSIPVIPAGQTWAPGGTTWTVDASVLIGDGSILRFDVTTTHGASTWLGGFARVVSAPKLEITGLRTSDALPVGNGDGIISPGEPHLLYVRVKNYGHGPAQSLTGALVALDGGSTVTTGAASFVDLGFMTEAENAAGFVLTEVDPGLDNPLSLTITDGEGRETTRIVELRVPAAPTIQSFDASIALDKIKITWNPGPSPDVAGYRVYRSTSGAGPFALASPDIIPYSVFTDAGLAPSTRFYYAITTIDSSGNESPLSAIASASTNPPQYTGWPNEMPDPSANSPAVGDIDGDGYPDVVVGNDFLYAWKHDGTEIRDGDGYPATWGVFSSLGSDFIGPAALARIDDIPGLDIVAAAYTSKEVYCFSGTGAVLPGWPKPTIDFVRGNVAVGDIDGNGDLEILAVDQDAYLYVWNTDGTEFIDGDLNPATDGVFKRLPDTNQWQYQPPALADIDGDLKDEIVIATQDKKLYVLNEDGSDVPGWPRTLPSYAGGGVAIGDIDNNGDLEIVVTVRGSGETYAINHDNTLMWTRWLNHNNFFNPSPALADITGDGKLEVLIPTSNGKLYAIQYNGSDAPGWPVTYSTKTYTESSPVVGDIDGDGQVDVLLGNEEKFIYAWSAAGVVLDGFPLVTKDAVRGTPVIADLDNNGDVEIVVAGYDKSVYVWDLTTPYDPARMPWPMLRANVHRNARYGFVVPTAVRDGGPRPLALSLAQNYPNPFNPTTTIDFTLPAGKAIPTTLIVYDVRGARVRTLVDGSLPGGQHHARWDGRNSAGSPVGSGVYFYRLAAGNRTETRKMVLLK